MSTAAVRKYWSRLVASGCIITGGPAEIAHCHGGSIVERMGEPKARGKKLPRYDWLVLPLDPRYAREPYKTGLDTDVAAWERAHGTQAMWIDLLCREYGIDLWAKANEGRK